MVEFSSYEDSFSFAEGSVTVYSSPHDEFWAIIYNCVEDPVQELINKPKTTKLLIAMF